MESLSQLPYMRLLPEENAGMLAKLELLARSKKQGSKTGKHVSPNKGFSVVFAEHRQYAHGDDIRDLDWRIFAKNNRYYIKQYIEETNLRATIVLDASGSMGYTGAEANTVGGQRLSKFAYAQHLAAAMAYLMIKQQDAVGYVGFDTELRRYVRPASRPSQVRVVLEQMYETTCAGDTALAPTLHEVAERLPRRGLVILLSDLFSPTEALLPALHHLAHRQHELVLFHTMAEEELTFHFRQSQEFKDLELSGTKIKVDPRSIRSAYLAKVKEHVTQIERVCGQLRADYVPVNTKVPYLQVLSDFLSRRDWR
jgi:uncharacterized protein (DUF58 family)